MAPMTGLEFQSTVLDAEREVEQFTTEQFGVVAASVVATIAIAPENYDKDTIVETIQNLALRMPADLVIAGTLHSMKVRAGIEQGLTG